MYGLLLDDKVNVGMGLHYLLQNQQYNVDGGFGDPSAAEIGQGIGVSAGILFAITPDYTLGASLFLPGDYVIAGNYEDSGTDTTYTGYTNNPVLWRLGASTSLIENSVLGVQFDINSGFAYDEIRDREDGTKNTSHLTADSVITTRIGAEYIVKLDNATMPIWIGTYFSPYNNFQTKNGFIADELLARKHLVPESSTFAAGMGYEAEGFSLGIAFESGYAKMDDGSGNWYSSIFRQVLVSGTYYL